MDCAEFEERWLEALDEGGAGDGPRGAARERAAHERAGEDETTGDAAHRDVDPVAESLATHLAGCRRCQDLVALLEDGELESGELHADELEIGEPETGGLETGGPDAIQPPGDLVAAVMARTSGGACERAGRLLAERLDSGHADAGGLDPLLYGHLEGCERCSTLARVLETMGPELAAMAEIEPDPDFVADVMAATVPAGPAVPATSDPSGAWRRLVLSIARSASWNRLVRRPRLALEGAFVASVAVVLLFGVSVESVSDVPTRVLAKARQERIEATDDLRRLTAANLEWLATVAEDRWSRVRRRVDPWLDVARAVGSPETPATGDAGEARAGTAPGGGDQDAWSRWKGRFLRVFNEIWSYFEAFIEGIGVASGDAAADA